MSRKRKNKRAEEAQAVPEEVLAEGSGPTQDAQELADAANTALADDGEPEEVVFEAEPKAEPKPETKSRRKRGKRVDVTSDEPVVDAEAVDDTPVEAAASDEPAADDESGVELADSEIGPELEEAEAEAATVAAADEQVLEDAVMRAEAEAELGAAEPEAAAGEEDVELNAALPTTAGSMDDLELKHLVEALIFAADKPVTMQRLRQLTRVSDVKRLEAALDALAIDFADRGIALQQVSGGYQFRTNTHFSTWVQQLIAGRPVRLSRAQLETLAIVAYRQPITRPEVDEIRGVDSSATLRLLMDRALIRILGKKEDVGRPILYGTTKEFLDFFSLGDLRELPTLREYSELSAESRQVMSDRLGIPADGMEAAAAAVEGADLESEPSESADASDAAVGAGMDATVDDLVRDFAQHDDEASSSSGEVIYDATVAARETMADDVDDTSIVEASADDAMVEAAADVGEGSVDEAGDAFVADATVAADADDGERIDMAGEGSAADQSAEPSPAAAHDERLEMTSETLETTAAVAGDTSGEVVDASSDVLEATASGEVAGDTSGEVLDATASGEVADGTTDAADASSDVVEATAQLGASDSGVVDVTASSDVASDVEARAATNDVVQATAEAATATSDVVDATAEAATATNDVVEATAEAATATSDVVEATAEAATATSDVVEATAEADTASNDTVDASAEASSNEAAETTADALASAEDAAADADIADAMTTEEASAAMPSEASTPQSDPDADSDDHSRLSADGISTSDSSVDDASTSDSSGGDVSTPDSLDSTDEPPTD